MFPAKSAAGRERRGAAFRREDPREIDRSFRRGTGIGRPGRFRNVTLEDEIDHQPRRHAGRAKISRPSAGTEFQATLVWMHAEPLDLHKIYVLKHTTRTVRARVKQIRYRVDINTLENAPATKLDMNEIARGGCENHAAAFLRSLSQRTAPPAASS